jgi:hypothetical protein
MTEEELSCRHCGRPIAIPAARCPWPGCRKTIMVICAACKQYTDDQGEFCQHCGQPLVPAEPVAIEPGMRPQTVVADLAADQERAQLLASSVIAEHASAFLLHSRQQQSTLIPLFGILPTAEQQGAAVLFGALTYLVQHGYATLARGTGATSAFLWLEARPWDGQERSLEAELARAARLETTVREVAMPLIAEAMHFRCEVVQRDSDGDRRDRWEVDWHGYQSRAAAPDRASESSLARWLGADTYSYSYSYRDVSVYTAPSGVTALARQTATPEYERAAACREIYQMLLDFIQTDPKRADSVADDICRAFDWFRRFRENPELVSPL